MTVKELIEKLKDLPEDAEVLRDGGEYLGDTRYINDVEYFKEAQYGIKPNTVVIS